MKRFLSLTGLLALALSFAACNGVSNSSSSMPPQNTQGQVFTTGEDAPVSSVVAFNITINSITLNNSTTTAQVLSTPTSVDFGRLVGLRSLLGFNAVAPGTYTSADFHFRGQQPRAFDQLCRTYDQSALDRHRNWNVEQPDRDGFIPSRSSAGGGEATAWRVCISTSICANRWPWMAAAI